MQQMLHLVFYMNNSTNCVSYLLVSNIGLAIHKKALNRLNSMIERLELKTPKVH